MKKITLLALLFIAHFSFAQIPKPKKNTYVNDFAKVLSADQIKELNRQIFEIENKSSVQFAVVLVNTVPSGLDIDDFALLVGKKWHVGKNKNGIVYVASISQHKQRLQIASNLASTFTNEKCAAILADVKPYFQQSDYNGGLTTLISKVSSTLAVVIQAPGSQTARAVHPSSTQADGKNGAVAGDDKSGSTLDGFIGLAFVVLVIVGIVYLLRRRRRNNMYNYNNMANNGPGYGGQYPPTMGGGSGSGLGTFVAGAATGALVGYAAERLMENHQQGATGTNQVPPGSNGNLANNDIPAEDNPENYGNWGDGNVADDSSSNDDTGFSDNSDNGATSNW